MVATELKELTRARILRTRDIHQLYEWLKATGKFPFGVYPFIDNLEVLPKFMPEQDLHIEHHRMGGWRVGTCFNGEAWTGWVECGKSLDLGLMKVVLLAILGLLDGDGGQPPSKKGRKACPGRKNGKS